MARRRKQKSGTDAFLDILPQLVGLVLLAVFFIPGFKQFLGALFYLIVGIGILAFGALIGWAIWKKINRSASAIETAPEAALAAWNGKMLTVAPVSPPTKALWTRELLSALEWRRFEYVVAAYSRELGYDAKTTRAGADGGVDIKLFQAGHTAPVMVIQCKAWDAYKVGIKPVRELYGVMAADKIANGAFFTTGEFTIEAEQFARDKNLDLVNGAEFLSRIFQLEPHARDALMSLATTGDYTTPTCPNCDTKMVLRTAGKGTNVGSEFWGCLSYPRCRQTFKVSRSPERLPI